jgi:hypothetical protein
MGKRRLIFWSSIHLTSTHYIYLFWNNIQNKSTQSNITVTLKTKTFESYSYSSSRRTKVNTLTTAIQVKYMLRHEKNSYWFKTWDQKCTISWKSQSFWLMLQSARISHQKWPWLKQYTFQSMGYTPNFIPYCGIVIVWMQL